MPETLRGTICALTFRNDETGYTVAQFEPDGAPAMTIVGVMPRLAAGEAVELLGDWVDHPRYGRQLKVAQVRPAAITSLAGLERYLDGGLIEGVGPAIAGRIVAHFGVATAHVLDHTPERLREVAGVGAARAEAITQQLAQTVHRLLEVQPQDGLLSFIRNETNPLDADLVIVDEASMLDLVLAYSLVRAIRPGAYLVLVGDVDRLPSVGPGTVLRDVIAAIEGGLPDAALIRLDAIFRQAAGSYIVDNAHRVVRGQAPVTDDPEATDFFLARTDDPARAAELIEQLVCERIPARFGFSSDDIQVLSPMHRGEAGVAALNARLQDALNPQWGDLGELKVGERVLREGDRVMQTVNDYGRDVFNGDVGRVLAVSTAEKRLSVDFDGNVVSYEVFELDELALAYALTIHKSQGSEFPAVVVPVLNSHHIMLQRNLLYTAISRARQLVVMVGDPKAIAVAVRNDKVRRRYTALAWRLGQVVFGLCR